MADMRTQSAGMTLVELMISLIVAAILLAFAVPSFREVILNNRSSTQSNDFLSALMLARSEAQKRVLPVQVCKSTNQTSCDPDGVNWEIGWLVFVDVDGGQDLDVGEPVLARSSGLSGGNTLRSGDFARFVQYFGSGRAQGGSGSFRLCDGRGVEHARQLTISAVGRPSVSSTLGAAACP